LELDRRSDIFAVGAVAYELLTFEKAFKVTSSSPFTLLEEVKQKIGERPHLQLSAVRPELDPALAIVVDRALAKRPEDRFQDLSAMRREISVIRERLQAQEAIDSAVTTRAVGSVSDPAATSLRKGDSAAADSETSFAAMKDNARPARWSIHAGVIAAVFLVAAAAAGVFHYLASFPSEAPQVAPSPPGIAPGSERSKESKNDDGAPQQRELTSQDVHPADRDKKATDDAEISRQLRLVVANATRHARAGELREALAKIESGLLIRADHAELNALLQEMFRDALRESTAEREAAVRRGASNAAASEFDRAANLEEEAAALRRSGRTPEAVRRLWLARETFASVKTAPDPPLPNTPGRTQNEQPEKLRSNAGAVPDRTTPREGTPRSPVGRTEAKDPPPLVSPEKPPDALPTETDSIRQVIREYEAAYRSMDVSALEQVVAVSPLEAERLREAFAEAKTYDLQVNIREIELSPDGRKASVRASVVHLITPKVGGQSFKNVGSATFELAFSDSRWKIVDVQNR
jgi:hypothetical protein